LHNVLVTWDHSQEKTPGVSCKKGAVILVSP
jgi:hypothetical protein